MRKLVLATPFVYLLFLLCRVDLSLTQDLGRHIVLGKIILASRVVPETNLFSYALPHQSFVNHHWLPEVVFYLFADLWGVSSILLLKVVLVMGAFAAIYYVANKLGGLYWSVLLSFPFLYIFSYRFDSRPELFSFLFLSLFVLFIFLYSRTKSWWYLLVLIPIQVMWVNSHIYFFVGGFVFFAFVFSEFVLGRRDFRLVALWGALVLSTVITPLGVRGATAPLTIFSNYGYEIVENKSILFLNSWFFTPQVLVLEVVVLLFVIGVLLTFSKKYLFWYLISIFGIVSAFAMIRNVSLFVILVYPVSVLVARLFEKKYIKGPSARAILVTFIGVIVFIQIVRGASSPTVGFWMGETGKGALDYIEEKKLSGPIFNNFDVGSYIIYRLYPGELVFVDGRPEAYTSEFFEEYRNIQSDPERFEQARVKYGFEMIVFSKSDLTEWARAFLTRMDGQQVWRVAYQDAYYVVLVPEGSENFRKAGLD